MISRYVSKLILSLLSKRSKIFRANLKLWVFIINNTSRIKFFKKMILRKHFVKCEEIKHYFIFSLELTSSFTNKFSTLLVCEKQIFEFCIPIRISRILLNTIFWFSLIKVTPSDRINA